jgi:PAS domain-containing protein
VPLKARRDTIGALTLVRRQPNAYDDEELAWAEDLAYSIALGVENQRLYLDARELFEQTVSANFVGTPDGRIVVCNERFAELLGFRSVDEVLATPTHALYVDERVRAAFLDDLCAKKRLVSYARFAGSTASCWIERRSASSKNSSDRRSGSKPSASWRGASRTISTIC